MIIQINTDKAIDGDKNNIDYFSELIREELKRYESNITRIEVHLKDENGNKEGYKDMLCMIEVRLKGKQPIAVTNQGDTVSLAITGAISKLNTAVKTIVEKVEKH